MTSFKEKLASGNPVSGPIVGDIRTVGAIKALSNAGHDFVWIDMEHAMIGWETLVPLVQFARLSGITPLVRATDLSYPLVARALDAGAIGIIVPRVDNVDQAEQAVSYASTRRWVAGAPAGRRGMAMSAGHPPKVWPKSTRRWWWRFRSRR